MLHTVARPAKGALFAQDKAPRPSHNGQGYGNANNMQQQMQTQQRMQELHNEQMRAQYFNAAQTQAPGPPMQYMHHAQAPGPMPPQRMNDYNEYLQNSAPCTNCNTNAMGYTTCQQNNKPSSWFSRRN